MDSDGGEAMRRPKVYISGPISNGSKATAEERMVNVSRACSKFLQIVDLGFAPVLPQLTEFVEKLTGVQLPHDKWMEIDLPWVEEADAVYRMSGESVGSDIEVEHAMKLRIPVFRDLIAMYTHFKVLGRVP